MLLQTAVLLSVLVLAAGYSCPNRLYRGQRLTVSQFLCSRNQNYRMLFNNTGKVQVNEAFLSNTSFKPIPLTLFSTNTTSPSPSHVTFTDAGDFVAVGTDGAVYWQANVSGADFLELQDTGIAVLFAKNASTVRVLWKSLSTYSLRLVGGTNQGRLEFYFNSIWGSVSNYDGFDNLAAGVACRTLGFDTGVVTTNTFGQSTGPVWMDAMSCTGRETVFQECPFGALGYILPQNWWGQVLSTSHTAISCQGNSSLGVLPPTAHVCTDRLYVGQTLALGESLCAGLNGEYTLRFSNKRLDTVIELWYKTERKWSIGKTNAMPAGAAVRLDSDGVMRIVNATVSLYNLFSNTTANASFVELQDNGVVRVVSANGSTGWRKAPDDICYTEKRKMYPYDSGKNFVSNYLLSPLACLASCDINQPTCKTIAYRETDSYCYLMSGYPWDTSTTNSTYFEKIAGCSSGAGCYQNYSYDRWTVEPIISISTSTASASACTSLCDSTATCVSAYYTPSTTTCILGWKRLNETVDNSQYTSYYRKSPCTPVDPSQVPLLPVKACPTQLLPGAFLLSQQYLCSPNGQHALTVAKDGRLLVDGGKWISNSVANRSGYLQYTTTNQLLLRLDDGSTPWRADAPSSMLNTPAGYLALSDGGIVQMFDSNGHVIWDHQSGFQLPLLTPMVDVRPDIVQLYDTNVTTCVSKVRVAKFSLSKVYLNTMWNVVMTGRGLQCGNASIAYTHSFYIGRDAVFDGAQERVRMDAQCSLLTAAPERCRFQCLCQRSLCEMLVLLYKGCGDPQGDICELAVD